MQVEIFVSQWLSDDGKDILTMANAYPPYGDGFMIIYEGTVEVPSLTINDLLPAHIAKLRKTQGDYQNGINQIEGRIQSLLCLEHKQVETDDSDLPF